MMTMNVARWTDRIARPRRALTGASLGENEALASLRVLICIAKANGSIAPDERMALEDTFSQLQLPSGATITSLLDEPIDLEAQLRLLTTPESRDLLYQSSQGLARLERFPRLEVQKLLDRIRTALQISDERASLTRRLINEAKDTLLPSDIQPSHDPALRPLKVKSDIVKYSVLTGVHGFHNTASGVNALRSNTTGYRNTASGVNALSSNTTGIFNSASGVNALRSNTTGASNTASGDGALRSNTTGSSNTASGNGALSSNTTGQRNIALGQSAGFYLTTGNDNIAIGNFAVAGESATIRIGTSGTHTRAFIAGIRGVTTGVANAIPVLVDSNGQLGTVSSSARFKEEIRDMGDLTDRLLELRPVVFHYKQEQALPDVSAVPLEYGLIAEEVAEVFPELVVYDDEGQAFTVKYHLLASMLLNELQKMHQAQLRLADRADGHEQEISDLLARLEALEAREATAEHALVNR